MIKLISKGDYRIVGTKDHKTLLYLDDQGYHWNYAPKIGELLTFSKHTHRFYYLIAKGKYRIFGVKNEPKLIDLQHLELSTGPNQWQGYLLLTGLPTAEKIRSKIIPTRELVVREGVKTYARSK